MCLWHDRIGYLVRLHLSKPDMCHFLQSSLPASDVSPLDTKRADALQDEQDLIIAVWQGRARSPPTPATKYDYDHHGEEKGAHALTLF